MLIDADGHPVRRGFIISVPLGCHADSTVTYSLHTLRALGVRAAVKRFVNQ
jgi:hypothetical protein